LGTALFRRVKEVGQPLWEYDCPRSFSLKKIDRTMLKLVPIRRPIEKPISIVMNIWCAEEPNLISRKP
tara:strand:+ start:6075 stop:6278 length:204 start_codon:yes stop_codon:yes gene_type:complete